MRTVVLDRGGCGGAATASIPASSISPATAVSARGCARRIGRKPRASRAVHPVPAAQLLPAAGQPAGAGGSDCRPRDSVAVGRWLREVANVRAHGTIGEILAERLVIEREQLKPVPTHFSRPGLSLVPQPRCSAVQARLRLNPRSVPAMWSWRKGLCGRFLLIRDHGSSTTRRERIVTAPLIH
jgi:hypothetical protein